MIVVDTNVITYLLIEGEQTVAAQELWSLDSDWRVPPLWRHELLNVLATLGKAGGLDLHEAQEIWRTALDLFASSEEDVAPSAALRLAVQAGISAYDAQFVILARRLEVPLVTEDRRLRARVPEGLLSLAQFCGLDQT